MRRDRVAAALAMMVLCSAVAGLTVRADGTKALTPPMGWNSWNLYACGPDFNEVNIRAQADAMVTLGLDALGYEYINLDGCWQSELQFPGDTGRDESGNMVADPARFPSGIAALADYVHARGLKLGIYTDIGNVGCKNRPGSAGHEAQDAAQFAAWGVDYVKVDWCESLLRPGMNAAASYRTWRDALSRYAPHIVLSICNWGEQAPWNWGPATGHLWRNTIDIWDEWDYDWNNRLSVTSIIDSNSLHSARARPGAWNDPDMLVVGLRGSGGVQGRGMSTDEYRAHFGMWAIMAAPLLLGNDLPSMDATALSIVSNPEVIAVNQDRLGIQAPLVRDSGNGLQVYAKPLEDAGSRAVAVLNRNWWPEQVVVTWTEIGLAAENATVRDLWARHDLGTWSGSITVSVPAHGMTLLKVVGTEPTFPDGMTYLSDGIATLAQNGWGPFAADTAVGDRLSGDGGSILLDGRYYAKGLGVHASSRIEYNLAHRCTSFSASIGVDDVVGSRGTVVFEVWADGSRVYQSPLMTGASPTEHIDVNITGARTLRLVVNEGDDESTAVNAYDHADWADARVMCGAVDTALSERFVSDLPFSVSRNGWGPAERDRSNGEAAGGDGQAMHAGGRHYPKGLGTHADSEILVPIAGAGCTQFVAEVGVDDEVGSRGSVEFQVRDQHDRVLWNSGVRHGSEPVVAVEVGITGVTTLKLVATDGGDGAAYDHADWGNARVHCAGGVQETAADPPATENPLRAVAWTSLTNASVLPSGAVQAWCDSCGAEAISVGTLTAGRAGTLRFTAGDGSHRYVGLSSRSGYHVTDFDFAFRAWGTTLNAYQDGEWVAGVSFVSSDVLSIAVSASGAVTFRKNGETIVPIVPLKSAPDGLRVKAALVDAWGSVENVAADF